MPSHLFYSVPAVGLYPGHISVGDELPALKVVSRREGSYLVGEA